MFVEYLSKSPVWKQSVVFIIEDDAQNGPDHVDAHRSTAYIAGPYVKRNFVDHTPVYNFRIIKNNRIDIGIAANEPVRCCCNALVAQLYSHP